MYDQASSRHSGHCFVDKLFTKMMFEGRLTPTSTTEAGNIFQLCPWIPEPAPTNRQANGDAADTMLEDTVGITLEARANSCSCCSDLCCQTCCYLTTTFCTQCKAPYEEVLASFELH